MMPRTVQELAERQPAGGVVGISLELGQQRRRARVAGAQQLDHALEQARRVRRSQHAVMAGESRSRTDRHAPRGQIFA